MSRQMAANLVEGVLTEGPASAVGQKPAISSQVTRPSRHPPAAPAHSSKWGANSASPDCQPISRSGPSKKPSSDTDIMKTIFLIAVLSRPRPDTGNLAGGGGVLRRLGWLVGCGR